MIARICVVVVAFTLAACGSPFWESGLHENGASLNDTDRSVWFLVDRPDSLSGSRYVTELEPGQEWPIAVCDRIGLRVSVYSEDPGGGTGVVEPQLPIEEALAVLQFGPDELICEGSGPKTLLVFDGDQITIDR